MNNDAPVDVVYLWVQGADPVWRTKRQAAWQRLSAKDKAALALYGNVAGRFRDNDELRYNLRALERFFPQHGHVYIVTDAQTPSWLRSTTGLTVVDHRTLIPPERLPVFDSAHIESYIHHIAGLSSRYFYLNDDIFFGAPVRLDDWFFEDGVAVVWSEEPEVRGALLRPDATALENACRLSRQWLQAQCHKMSAGQMRKSAQEAQTPRTFAHAPRPMLKSVLFDLEVQAADLFAMVRSTTFRTWNKPTVVSDFVMRWALAQGRAQLRAHTQLYIATGEDGLDAALQTLMQQVGKVDFFCVNDTCDDAPAQDPRFEQIRKAFETIFPVPSRFE